MKGDTKKSSAWMDREGGGAIVLLITVVKFGLGGGGRRELRQISEIAEMRGHVRDIPESGGGNGDRAIWGLIGRLTKYSSTSTIVLQITGLNAMGASALETTRDN